MYWINLLGILGRSVITMLASMHINCESIGNRIKSNAIQSVKHATCSYMYFLSPSHQLHPQTIYIVIDGDPCKGSRAIP